MFLDGRKHVSVCLGRSNSYKHAVLAYTEGVIGEDRILKRASPQNL